jgi:hypothetical protein
LKVDEVLLGVEAMLNLKDVGPKESSIDPRLIVVPQLQGKPAVDKLDIAILQALDESKPKLINHYEIETATRITRKTIGQRIRALITVGLVDRPHGRKRVTITSKGTSLLATLPPNDVQITP